MLSLQEVVDHYLRQGGGFGTSVELKSLACSNVDVSQLFSAFDEDYHISRFLHFTNAGGEEFTINGFPATHVSIDAQIRSLF